MPFEGPHIPPFLPLKDMNLTRLHRDDDPLAVERERGDDAVVGGRHLGREESTGSEEPGLGGLEGVLEVGFVGRWWVVVARLRTVTAMTADDLGCGRPPRGQVDPGRDVEGISQLCEREGRGGRCRLAEREGVSVVEAQAFPSLVGVDERVPRFRDPGRPRQSLGVVYEREDVECEFGG